jgi:hypothetical protein
MLPVTGLWYIDSTKDQEGGESGISALCPLLSCCHHERWGGFGCPECLTGDYLVYAQVVGLVGACGTLLSSWMYGACCIIATGFAPNVSADQAIAGLFRAGKMALAYADNPEQLKRQL